VSAAADRRANLFREGKEQRRKAEQQRDDAVEQALRRQQEQHRVGARADDGRED
jgi:hypothetical protein